MYIRPPQCQSFYFLLKLDEFYIFAFKEFTFLFAKAAFLTSIVFILVNLSNTLTAM
jgi:hypothetical protein